MFISAMVVLLLFPQRALTGALEGMRVALEVVLPSILPFAVMSSAAIFSGVAEKAGNLFAPLFIKLRLNPYGAVAFLASLMGGYPTGCKIVCDMYREGLVDKSEAEKMLSYTNNGGIVFALNVCGREMLGSLKEGLVVFVSSALASAAVAFIFAKSDIREVLKREKKKPSFPASLGKALASGGSITVNVISAFVVFYALANALCLDKVPIVAGLFEMTKGVGYAGGLHNTPLAAFFFSFGGMSVLAQSSALAAEGDISLKKCIAGKIVAALLAFVIAYILSGEGFAGKDIMLFLSLAVIVISCGVRLAVRVK